MHPEIEQDHPGDCPICGMALEPKGAVASGDGDEENPELRDMTRRLWVAAPLAIFVMTLSMGGMIRGAEFLHGPVSRWTQFGLSNVVVLWAGLPFFVRGWRSVMTWNLKMFLKPKSRTVKAAMSFVRTGLPTSKTSKKMLKRLEAHFEKWFNP